MVRFMGCGLGLGREPARVAALAGRKRLGPGGWRLDFPDSDGSNPTLQVNRNIPEISNLASRDDVFLAPWCRRSCAPSSPAPCSSKI